MSSFPHPLVAVRVTRDGVRLSRVTPHGEELIEADVEAKALAVKLWAQVAGGEPVPYEPLDDLKAAALHIAQAKADLVAPLYALDAILERLHGIEARMAGMEALLKAKKVTRDDVKAWIDAALTRSSDA